MLLMAPGFQTVIALAILNKAPSVPKWSFYNDGKKFRHFGAEGENKIVVSVKI